MHSTYANENGKRGEEREEERECVRRKRGGSPSLEWVGGEERCFPPTLALPNLERALGAGATHPLVAFVEWVVDGWSKDCLREECVCARALFFFGPKSPSFQIRSSQLFSIHPLNSVAFHLITHTRMFAFKVRLKILARVRLCTRKSVCVLSEGFFFNDYETKQKGQCIRESIFKQKKSSLLVILIPLISF